MNAFKHVYVYLQRSKPIFFFSWGGKKGQGRRTVAKALASTKLVFKIKKKYAFMPYLFNLVFKP